MASQDFVQCANGEHVRVSAITRVVVLPEPVQVEGRAEGPGARGGWKVLITVGSGLSGEWISAFVASTEAAAQVWVKRNILR